MSHKDNVLPCPFCAGHGGLRRSEIIELFSDPNFRQKVDSYLAEVRRPTEDNEDAATLVEAGNKPRDFFKGSAQLEPAITHMASQPKGVSYFGGPGFLFVRRDITDLFYSTSLQIGGQHYERWHSYAAGSQEDFGRLH